MIDYNNHKTNNHKRKQAMGNVTQKKRKVNLRSDKNQRKRDWGSPEPNGTYGGVRGGCSNNEQPPARS